MSNKAALLVGINRYADGNNLRGCCNDVDNSFTVLTDIFGYESEQITVLKNEDATTENILEQLSILVGKLEEGDDGFFHFSGHGSQVADKDGDEADFKDELICPHDMDWRKRKYITDDDLAKIFSGIPNGAWLEVILDSCFSGTATKAAGRRHSKTILSPHLSSELPIRRMTRAVEHVGNHILWSACSENQTSSDAYLGGKFNGAFTYFWVKLFRENTNILRHQLLEKIRSKLKKWDFDQVPQLSVSSSD